jgi:hypothetical protein
MGRTAFFVTSQEYCIQYCRCEEVIMVFRFLLSPYIPTGTWTDWSKGAVNKSIIGGSTNSENACCIKFVPISVTHDGTRRNYFVLLL